MEITKKVIKDWSVWKDRLAMAKEKESELRKVICSKILRNKEKGTVNDILFDIPLKAVAKINRFVDREALRSIWRDLSKKEKACIKFKPELVEKEYKKLPKDSKLHSVIETKPGMPSLEVKKDGD